jgi:CheY-like chemotaxis protein
MRNPLGAISAAADVLESCDAQSENAVEARAIIARQARLLAAIMNDVQDVARLAAGKATLALQPLDLAVLAQQAALRAKATSGPRLSCRLDSAWTDGDAVRLEQALSSLLADALRSTPPEGEVVLSVRREDGAALIEIEQGGEHGSSPGIGVALAARVVELHGGTLEVRPSAAGTVVTVRLRAREPVVATLDDRLPAQRRRQVLVVDANGGTLAALRDDLERDGHTVSAVHDARDGLERLLAQRPDIAIVDLGLPAGASLGLAQAARAAGYAGRMIALAADDGARAEAMVAGFDACLARPVDRAQMRACLAVS